MEEFDPRRASLDLVTAFVSNNKLDAAALPALLGDVFAAVSKLGSLEPEASEPKATDAADKIQAEPEPKAASDSEPAPNPAAEPAAAQAPTRKAASRKSSRKTASPAPEKAVPAVSIEEATRDPDFIVSLITGEKFKTLKRHLKKHGLTEAEYRQRFGLPDNYPLVSASYSEKRRDIARNIVRAAKDGAPAPAMAEEASPAVEEAATPATAKPPRKAPERKKPASAAKSVKSAEPAAEPAIDPAPEAAAPEAGETAKPASRRRRARPSASAEAAAPTETAAKGKRGGSSKSPRGKAAKAKADQDAAPSEPAAPEASEVEAAAPEGKRGGKLSAVFG